ncbi:hypothetical protein GGF43_006272, partial [Coemansia sp. RSA 2618]
MSTFPNRRRTTGTAIVPVPNNSAAAPSRERDLEHGASLHGDLLHPAYGLSARSIRIASGPRAMDTQTVGYSQTPDSIRDRTMMLSSLALHSGKPGNRSDAGGAGDSRRSSMDDRSSINQLLAEASSGTSNLSRLLHERSPPVHMPALQYLHGHDGAGSVLPRVDYSYIGAERVPKNAKLAKSVRADMGEEQAGDYGRPAAAAAAQGQPLAPLHADMAKRHPDDTHVRGEQDRLLAPQASAPAMGGDSGYARLQRRSHAALGLLVMPLQYVPAVVLGLIMNLLDGLSYGLIAFPVSVPVFAKFGPVGFSMYMLSSAVAQFVFSGGASAFRGANGTMLIEAIPFLHAICSKVLAAVGAEQPERVVATTMAAYVLSTVLTGLVFFLLGFLRIGVLVDFFPRHILVGCIGGVGYFLLQTGMEVTSRLQLRLSWP